jgi:hypothetical protein
MTGCCLPHWAQFPPEQQLCGSGARRLTSREMGSGAKCSVGRDSVGRLWCEVWSEVTTCALDGATAWACGCCVAVAELVVLLTAQNLPLLHCSVNRRALTTDEVQERLLPAIKLQLAFLTRLLKSFRTSLGQKLVLELLAVLKELIGELSLLKKAGRDAERFEDLFAVSRRAELLRDSLLRPSRNELVVRHDANRGETLSAEVLGEACISLGEYPHDLVLYLLTRMTGWGGEAEEHLQAVGVIHRYPVDEAEVNDIHERFAHAAPVIGLRDTGEAAEDCRP